MLKLININKHFQEGLIKKSVFTNLNLEIDDHDFITIIGSNGAGKSTLLNIIAGDIHPDSGEIILKNKKITKMKDYKRAKIIGRVHQNPAHGTAPHLTILENLAMVDHKNKGYGLSFAVNRKKISAYKERLASIQLGLEKVIHMNVSLLSGGERQALSLLMATVVKPELLLLDEHTAALDPNTAHLILELTDKLVKEANIPTLMVTHNMNDALKYGNRLIMMNKGKIILDLKGEAKSKLTVEQLLGYFKEANALSDQLLFI